MQDENLGGQLPEQMFEPAQRKVTSEERKRSLNKSCNRSGTFGGKSGSGGVLLSQRSYKGNNTVLLSASSCSVSSDEERKSD